MPTNIRDIIKQMPTARWKRVKKRAAELIAEELCRQRLEDRLEMTPEFKASIERGEADLAAGRTRIVRP